MIPKSTLSLLVIGLVLAQLACARAGRSAGAATGRDALIARVQAKTRGLLPAGDTLVFWESSTPVVVQTAWRHGDTVRAGAQWHAKLLTTEVIWHAGRPTRFTVTWRDSLRESYHLTGEVRGHQLVLSGARDTSVTIPIGFWAVSEETLDQPLLPLFEQLPEGSPTAVAVFRPLEARWDTLTVSVDRQSGYRVVSVTVNRWLQYKLVPDPAGPGYLWWQQVGAPFNETRPLEGSRRFAAFERAQASLGPLLAP